jgi:hypothetical protein
MWIVAIGQVGLIRGYFATISELIHDLRPRSDQGGGIGDEAEQHHERKSSHSHAGRR